jgi:poly-gamma-glutamate capsule biosynthesis protein CapA/YwtB (metallophosphatase superfamily)
MIKRIKIIGGGAKGSKKRRRLALLISLLLCGSIALFWVVRHCAKPTPVTKATLPPPHAGDDRTVHLALMGDMLAHGSVVNKAKTGSTYNFADYFATIRPLYKNADIVFCNPETPVAGEQLGVSSYPSFNAPNAFASDLVGGAGCNLINLATNHMADKGQKGIDHSLAVWNKLPILASAGSNSSAADQNSVRYFTVKGVKFAFLAFMDFCNARPPKLYSVNSYHDSGLVKRLMQEASGKADFVMVSMHWGTEDSTSVNVDQKQAAQTLADLGANLVIGTGPHVLQPMAVLNRAGGGKTYVLYSIGNVLSSQLLANELTGVIVTMDIQDKKLKDVKFIPTFMSYDWPQADRAARKLRTRSNLQLRPLKDAADDITKMFPSETYAKRLNFIKAILGPDAHVE